MADEYQPIDLPPSSELFNVTPPEDTPIEVPGPIAQEEPTRPLAEVAPPGEEREAPSRDSGKALRGMYAHDPVALDDPSQMGKYLTKVSFFGGRKDYHSGQDNGQYAFGGGSYDPKTDTESQIPTIALPPPWFKRGVIKPGQQFPVYNPRDPSKQIMVAAVDKGPAYYTNRGADLYLPRKEMKDHLGLETDETVGMDLTAVLRGQAPALERPPQPGTAYDQQVGQAIRADIGQIPDSQKLAGDYTADALNQALKKGPQSVNDDGSLDYGGGLSVYPKTGIIQYDTPAAVYQYHKGDRKPHIINKKPVSPDDLANINPAEDLKGEDLLKSLPPSLQADVKSIAEYKYPKISSFALKSPHFHKLLNWAARYNPDFDAKQFDVTLSAMKDFSTGRGSNIRLRSNEALAQVPLLVDSINRLNNNPTIAENWRNNTWNRYTGTNPEGQQAVTDYESNARTFASAVAGQLKGGNAAATTVEMAEHVKDLGVNLSASSQMGVVASKTHAMLGQLAAVKDRALSGLPKGSKLPWTLINEPSIEAVKQVMNDPRVHVTMRNRIKNLLEEVAPEGASEVPAGFGDAAPPDTVEGYRDAQGKLWGEVQNPDGSVSYKLVPGQ